MVAQQTVLHVHSRQAYAKAETEARECEAENEAKTEAKELL